MKYKVICTTDSSLKFLQEQELKDNRGKFNTVESLPRPSDAFIKKYVDKQGKIDEVLVEYETKIMDPHKDKFGDIRYNKFERRLKVAPDNTIVIKPPKESWNREEVTILLRETTKEFAVSRGCVTKERFDEWINDNL